MRIWHKNLIVVLPEKQLIAQWRELCCIVKNISDKGTANHLLVNKVLQYPMSHLIYYTDIVLYEMRKRNYNISEGSYLKYVSNLNDSKDKFNNDGIPCLTFDDLFKGWHNERYMRQCFYNLQEKYDCGGIKRCEYIDVLDAFTNDAVTTKKEVI